MYTPLARGFDEHMGYFQGAIDYYRHTGGAYGGTASGVDWHRGNETTCYNDNGTYTAELIVPHVDAYFAQRAATPSQPFFLYLPWHLIHGPNQVPDRFQARRPAHSRFRASVDAACSLNATGQSRVTLSPRSERLRAAW